MWVFIFHATHGLQLPIIEFGYVGVDVFFLLSGFVLAHVCRDGIAWREYPAFLQARAARIFPLHLAVLAAVALVVLSWPDFTAAYPLASERFGLSAFVATALLIQNWAIWPPGSWNAPAWSLSAEWFGYLVLPVFLMISRRIAQPWAAVALCYTALAVLLGILTLKGVTSLGITGMPGMVRMACEMAGGCCLYRAFACGVRLTSFAGAAGVILFGAGMLHPDGSFLVLLAIPIVILGAADGSTFASRVLTTRPARLLGEISFSIYLTHWLVLQMSNRVLPLGATPDWAILPYLALLSAIVLAISMVTYRWIELPSRRWGRARPRRVTHLVAVTG